jgi:Glycosyl transferase family 2
VPISESEISILIPTYKYRDKVVRAVQSALDSGAGEIIVVDDRGRDGTMERLAAFSDPRLTIRENERNVGLWENHLVALNMATRPWIKFIQADDYLLPGGLAAFAAAVDDGVTVVFSTPTIRDDATGAIWHYHHVASPRRTKPIEIQDTCLYVGWLLGAPSHMMLRSDAIERDPQVWRTTISADLVVGSIAAASGDTVLLPVGAIGQGAHPLQDAKTQNALLGLERAVASLSYLRQRPEPGLRRLANLWAYLGFKSLLKTTARGLVRREAPALKLVGYPWRAARDLSLTDWRDIYQARARLRDASRFRRLARTPFDLDQILSDISSKNAKATRP